LQGCGLQSNAEAQRRREDIERRIENGLDAFSCVALCSFSLRLGASAV